MDLNEAVTKLKSRRTAESETEQPEGEVVDVSKDTPEEEIEAEAEESEELVEEVEEVQEDGSEAGQDTLVYDIGGKEYTQEQITEALEGNMRLSDYTRKTQGVAEDRKSLEAKAEKQNELLDSLQSHIDLLAEMTDAEFKDINWDELRELNTAEYLKLKESKETKQDKLDKARSTRKKLLDDKRADRAGIESAKLFDALEWRDNKDKQEKDTALIQSYLTSAKWTDEEFGEIINHKHMLAIVEAAKFRELKSKSAATVKKVKKAPTVVKGKKASVTSIQRQVNEAEAKLKASGKIEDAMALRKLKRQL